MTDKPLWTSEEAAAATGGRTGAWDATGVSIDTRTLRPGDLFVALADARDGHDFVAAALARGAAAALVSRVPDGVDPSALLIVPDVLQALRDLGSAARRRTGAKVIGVTGSVGKTSTKEMLRAALGGQGIVHAAEASYNNHWGVPLTLARMPADTDFAVIEIGMNHPGEIAPLARLADLDIALITTVAPAHLAAFAGIAEIAEEKAAIMDGLRPTGTAILPADLEVTPILTARAAGFTCRTFGETGDYRLLDAQVGEHATVMRAAHAGREMLFKIATPGRHFAMNALGVVAVADALGLDPALTMADLGRWRPPAGRGTRERVILDPIDDLSFDLVDDAFNANPASVAASLEVVAVMKPQDGVGRLGKGRRIAVLGDMLELGPREEELHAAIADHPVLARFDIVHCVGPRMRALHAALPRRLRGEWTETAAELAKHARTLVDAGDIVLVKGSKSAKVSLVVDALRKLGQATVSLEQGTD
ncbi:UDP-N-acetylmuramoyl-tripeptide--D-alanyl-D-alanine ligase [Falsirhodobacter algicola]|uniref:UDP-N-acetylmuramoyl-tripeptide--D-alanyl-D-alanine ligase n=1 Tax=Falsirhodobacter algicola TaxID=2692330 RepID=A0A8J8SK45_9RHOB|nr:UDP-N-acetylmuramoyl-tripeptide--D-alanyl-D-alanine ligase [Falsirhodobacter algicola]QUS35009.1 UDP-N-acetylmuramoyl-tripeptide--D-alanyl-D-alanine ligase [Falsirhodobacter algicola]